MTANSDIAAKSKPSKVQAQSKGRPENLTNAGKGRVKGVPNKTTALLKDAILMAAQQAGGPDGMVGYLKDQADRNPGPFMSLLGKVLPMQVVGEGDGPLQVVIRRLGED